MIDYLVSHKTQKRLYTITVEERSVESRNGRFGGGWNYSFGVVSSKRSLILNVGVFSIRITLFSLEKNEHSDVVRIKESFWTGCGQINIDLNIPDNIGDRLLHSEYTIAISNYCALFSFDEMGTLEVKRKYDPSWKIQSIWKMP